MYKITINNQEYFFKKKKSLVSILNDISLENKNRIVAAIVNNNIKDLNYTINKDCKIKFLDRSGVLGNRIYRRSLFMVLAKAVYDLYPEGTLSIEYSLGNGIFCELNKNTLLNQKNVEKIEATMRNLVEKNIPINKHIVNKNEAINIFDKQNFQDKINLFSQIEKNEFKLYELDGYYDYFYYNMVPSTGYLNLFKLHYSYPGFVILIPQKQSPDKITKFKDQPKLGRVFQSYEEIGNITDVANVSDLNSTIANNNFRENIIIAEALHEKKIAQIADEIYNNFDNKKIILIAGPSSSGKTTFTKRLSIQLKINKLRPAVISIDDYFVNRENTPRDEEGNRDFEALEAIDLELLNEHLIKLLQGEEVEIPIFNFQKGKREKRGKNLKLGKNQPLLLEGIHGLNDKLTAVIPDEKKYKIYVSALTQLNIDRHNRIPTTDTRVIRRIIRDHKFRNHTAKQTLQIWPNVRRGEEKNIFPYQENADIMFNSALIYEFSVLKNQAVPLLSEIKKDEEVYYEALRLLELLDCFYSIPENEVPDTSILKEFTGGSSFRD
ncbi:MAG: nucleoside kinase [bacterium]